MLLLDRNKARGLQKTTFASTMSTCYLNVSTESGSQSSRLPVDDSAKQVTYGAAESSHDGERGKSGGVVLRLTDVEQVGAARRLTSVTAAVQQHDADDRQSDAVRRQQTARLHHHRPTTTTSSSPRRTGNRCRRSPAAKLPSPTHELAARSARTVYLPACVRSQENLRRLNVADR